MGVINQLIVFPIARSVIFILSCVYREYRGNVIQKSTELKFYCTAYKPFELFTVDSPQLRLQCVVHISLRFVRVVHSQWAYLYVNTIPVWRSKQEVAADKASKLSDFGKTKFFRFCCHPPSLMISTL